MLLIYPSMSTAWRISVCVAKLHLFPKGVQGDAELLRSLADFFG